MRPSPAKMLLATLWGIIGLASVNAAADSTLNRIQSQKTIRVGINADNPPLGYTDAATHQLTGFEVELGRDIARHLGAKAVLVPIGSANRLQFLQTGKVDILLSNMQRTPEREQILNYVPTPYKYGFGTALIKKGAGITRWEQLKGQTVCMTQSSNYAKPLIERYGAKVRAFPSVNDSLLTLKGGGCVAAVHDGTGVPYLLATSNEWHDYDTPIAEPLLPSPTVIWVKKGQTDTVAALDKIVQNWHDTGWLEQLVAKHQWTYLRAALSPPKQASAHPQ